MFKERSVTKYVESQNVGQNPKLEDTEGKKSLVLERFVLVLVLGHQGSSVEELVQESQLRMGEELDSCQLPLK